MGGVRTHDPHTLSYRAACALSIGWRILAAMGFRALATADMFVIQLHVLRSSIMMLSKQSSMLPLLPLCRHLSDCRTQLHAQPAWIAYVIHTNLGVYGVCGPDLRH